MCEYFFCRDDSAVEETNQSEESFKATPQSLASVADFAKGINPFLSVWQLFCFLYRCLFTGTIQHVVNMYT